MTARLTLLALATAAAATASAPAAPAAHAAPLRSLGGQLEIRHTDDFKHGRSATSYQLVRHGRQIPLALTHAPQVRSGTAVVVTGRRAGSRLKGTLRPLNRSAKAAAYVAGPHKTAVILVKFSPTASEPWTPDYVRQRVFTDPDSTNAYYKEDSYGDISLVGKIRPDGDVYGWYAIPPPVSGKYGCDPDAIASDAEAAATAADHFSPAGYDHVIYAFPYQSLCGWAGLGEVPGSQSWINGYIDQVDVVAHELGHNMGLAHAASMSCTDAGTPVAIGPSCTTDEYGDPFDVMGDISAHRNNAWHLSQIGFMPADNVQTANGEGTYTLSATSGRGGVRLLRIKRPAGSFPPYYDLELRASSGVFDDFLSTDPAVQGVMIHTDPDTPVVDWSRLIDATPGSAGGFDDAALPVGRTFSDGIVTIKLQSVTAGVATIDVTTGAPPEDLTPPTVPGPVTVAASPTSVALSWAASSDDFGVAGYRVYRGSTQLTTTGSLTWTDTVVTPGSVYTYRVSAYDAAGHATSSAPVTVTVPQPPPTDSGGGSDPTSTDPTGTTPQPGGATSAGRDLKRPRVRIKSPSRRSRVRGRATVRAVATDNVRVARMEVWVDLKRRKSVRGGKLSWRWVVRHARPGRHVIAVRAFDAAGNESTATVRPFVVR